MHVTYSVNVSSHAGAGTCGIQGVPLKRIISGQDATHGSWPWQVSIKFRDILVCGGVLIAPNHVLSAAHCFKDIPKHYFKVLTVVAGWFIGFNAFNAFIK